MSTPIKQRSFFDWVSLLSSLVTIILFLIGGTIYFYPSIKFKLREMIGPRYYIPISKICYPEQGILKDSLNNSLNRGTLDVGLFETPSELRKFLKKRLTFNVEYTPVRNQPDLDGYRVTTAKKGEMFYLEQVQEHPCADKNGVFKGFKAVAYGVYHPQ